MTDLTLSLNPNHNIADYAESYAKDGMVRIESLFPQDTAEAIYSILSKATPWRIVHSDAQGAHRYYNPQEWNALPAAERQEIVRTVLARANTSPGRM